MSRLTDLIQQAKQRDPQLGADLEGEFKALSSRRAFGLNFERHRPEAVELPQRVVRRGDKVRVLPERGSSKRGDQRLWSVKRIEGVDGVRLGHLEVIGATEPETHVAATDDLVVVAEFRDLIYPGLISTGKVERSLILTANRAATDWYPLFPNPVVAESILDRVINTAHHVAMPGRSYRPNRRPGQPAKEKQ